MNIINFVLLLLKMPTSMKYMTKQRVFPHCAPTHSDQSVHRSLICLKFHMFTRIVRAYGFVLNINGEEWIKVMDEHIEPIAQLS